MNKGWAGLTLEKALGIGNDRRQASNGDFWELKLVPLRKNKQGNWRVKESMAITMIQPEDVVRTPFAQSHLCDKMKKMIICGRARKDERESSSVLLYVNSFDLLDSRFWETIKRDYEWVQQVIREKGFDELTGKMGKIIQPRTKGKGHGSHTRAFYARPSFVEIVFGIREA